MHSRGLVAGMGLFGFGRKNGGVDTKAEKLNALGKKYNKSYDAAFQWVRVRLPELMPDIVSILRDCRWEEQLEQCTEAMAKLDPTYSFFELGNALCSSNTDQMLNAQCRLYYIKPPLQQLIQAYAEAKRKMGFVTNQKEALLKLLWYSEESLNLATLEAAAVNIKQSEPLMESAAKEFLNKHCIASKNIFLSFFSDSCKDAKVRLRIIQ